MLIRLSPPRKQFFVCDWNRAEYNWPWNFESVKTTKKKNRSSSRSLWCRCSRCVSIARRFLLLLLFFFLICFVPDDAHPKILINLTGSCLTRLLSFCRRSSAHWAYSTPLHSLSLSLIYCIICPWILNFIFAFFLRHWPQRMYPTILNEELTYSLQFFVRSPLSLRIRRQMIQISPFFFLSFFSSSFSRSPLSIIAFPPFSFLLSLDRFSWPLKG